MIIWREDCDNQKFNFEIQPIKKPKDPSRLKGL